MYAFALNFNPELLGDMLFALLLLALVILFVLAISKRKSDKSTPTVLFVALALFVFTAVMFIHFKRDSFSGQLDIKYNIGGKVTSPSEENVKHEMWTKDKKSQQQAEPAPQKQKPQTKKQVDEISEEQKAQQASVKNVEDQHEDKTVFVYRSNDPETEESEVNRTKTHEEHESEETILLPEGPVVNVNYLALIDGTERPKRERKTVTITNPEKGDVAAVYPEKEDATFDPNKVSTVKCKHYEDTNLGIWGLGLPFGPPRNVCLILEVWLPDHKVHDRDMIEEQLNTLLTQFFGKYDGIFRDNNDYDNPEDPSDQARLDKKFREFIHQSKNHGFVGKNWQSWLEAHHLEVSIDFYLKHYHKHNY